MKGRKAIAVALILAVGACPLVGIASTIASVVPRTKLSAQVVCPCCCRHLDTHQPANDQAPQERNSPSPDHSNCICAGAVITASGCDIEFDADISSLDIVAIDERLGRADRAGFVANGRRGIPQFPPLATGRDVRILRTSFLI
jgi:hypothetical protein